MRDSLDQPLEGMRIVASIAGAAIMLWVVYGFSSLLDDAAASAPGGNGGVVANDWLVIGLDQVLPLLFIGLIFFALIAQAIKSRRVT